MIHFLFLLTVIFVYGNFADIPLVYFLYRFVQALGKLPLGYLSIKGDHNVKYQLCFVCVIHDPEIVHRHFCVLLFKMILDDLPQGALDGDEEQVKRRIHDAEEDRSDADRDAAVSDGGETEVEKGVEHIHTEKKDHRVEDVERECDVAFLREHHPAVIAAGSFGIVTQDVVGEHIGHNAEGKSKDKQQIEPRADIGA